MLPLPDTLRAWLLPTCRLYNNCLLFAGAQAEVPKAGNPLSGKLDVELTQWANVKGVKP